MARTWSNAKRIDDGLSAAQRAKNKPGSLTIYVILLVAVTVFFTSLMAYTLIRAERHPATEIMQTSDVAPKDN